MSKADYRKIFCEDCMSQSQCGYYRDNNGDYCPMLKYYDMGYYQAEKDLELSWEDIKTIDKLLNQCVDCNNPYQEVLKRFKETK